MRLILVPAVALFALLAAPAAGDDKADADLKAMVGKWKLTKAELGGKDSLGLFKELKFEITEGGKYALELGVKDEGTFTVDLGKTPTPNDRAAAALVRVRLTATEGRLAEARTQLGEALRAEGYPAMPSTAVHQLLEYASRLAIEAGDRDEAVRLARSAIAACERDLGTQEPSAYTGRAHLTLALALLASDRPADARLELARAETLAGEAAGVDHPWAREATAKLAQLPSAGH